MLQFVLIVVFVLLLAGAAFFFMIIKGVDVAKFEYLREPQISSLPDITVVEVVFDTSTDGLKEMFGYLYKSYFKIKGVPKRPGKMPPSVARYENALDFEMEAEKRKAVFQNMIWKGSASIQLPADITAIPLVNHKQLTAKTTVWKYGETAEILHIGAYEDEASTVIRLRKYIKNQGYEITGLHEEVYLRSPGTPFCKPQDYYTIIRYPVKKK